MGVNLQIERTAHCTVWNSYIFGKVERVWGKNSSSSSSRSSSTAAAVIVTYIIKSQSHSTQEPCCRPAYLSFLLCEHGQFSAILERTQSNHSDCRHWIEGVSTTKPGTESFFSTLNREETSYPIKSDRLLIKNVTNIHVYFFLYWRHYTPLRNNVSK